MATSSNSPARPTWPAATPSSRTACSPTPASRTPRGHRRRRSSSCTCDLTPQRAVRQDQRRRTAEQGAHQPARHRQRPAHRRQAGQRGGRQVQRRSCSQTEQTDANGKSVVKLTVIHPATDPERRRSSRTRSSTSAWASSSACSSASAWSCCATSWTTPSRGPATSRTLGVPVLGMVPFDKRTSADADRVPRRPAQRAVRGLPPAADQPAVRRRRQPAAHHRGHQRDPGRGQVDDRGQPGRRAGRGRLPRLPRSRPTCAAPRSPARSAWSATSASPPR